LLPVSRRDKFIGALATFVQAIRGGIALLALGLNTVVLTAVLFLCSIAKLLALTDSARSRVRRFLARLPVAWIAINNGIFALLRITQWDIEVPPALNRDGCYLVLSNHQTWADVLILQRSFNRRLPLFRFFVKKALIWLPFLGAAWWTLDMPFMQRYSKEQLDRHPELKGRDLENARQACEKFRQMPVAMMNFPEGTRFTSAKRLQLSSPYRRLLEPHIGGIGQVLYALGDELDTLIDVTIVFPGRGDAVAPTLWQLLSGQVERVMVRARQLPIPRSLRGRNFRTDADFRRELERWVEHLWQEKDELIVSSES
jgi:1-acyl-sn-glycerol-3-phosphate acyltransferase